MNRKIFEVEACFKSRVVVAEGALLEEMIKKFLFEHPERMEVKSTWVCDVELLEEWEVKK